MRALILVLDSVGIGSAPDAAAYGDAGSDTLGHIAERCAKGHADSERRAGKLSLPNLVQLGLGEACRLAGGTVPIGLESRMAPIGRYASAIETSKGKDTPSGHWELAGVPVSFAWNYFPDTHPCFPPLLIDELCRRADLPGIIGDRHASGTEIIGELGAEHIQTTKPICYTSADSVFQIAAHEQHFGLDRLYAVCEAAHDLMAPLKIGRVIARPFLGSSPDTFTRTANRRDYSIPPPAPTLLDRATDAERDVVTIGKIADIFAHSGTGRALKGNGNDALFDATLRGLRSLADGGLLFANFIDFDTLYGHRRDIAGYAAALEFFDKRLPELLSVLRQDDLLIITADHGCDPSWRGTDHTREQVPVLAIGGKLKPGACGQRTSFSDVAATVAAHLHLPLQNGNPL
jgi:phosphopentomutase